MDNNKIGKYILKLRKEKGLTQQELGDKLFVTDKAVSKWERGLSLPDISILEKLSEILDTDIYSILQIEERKNVDLEEVIEKEKQNIKKSFKKKITFYFIPIMIIILIFLFKLIPFGYNVQHVKYLHNTDKLVDLAVPKFSFNFKNNEDNYSYHSFRGTSVLKSEIKNYVNTLNHITCNNTAYYYDEINDVTIADYSVKGNILYSTISYIIKNGNYCNTLKIKEYSEKLGYLNKMFILNKETSSLYVQFLPLVELRDNEIDFTATTKIYYHSEKDDKTHILEASNGTFEIIDDELIYNRLKIDESSENVNVPIKSIFVIKKNKLIIKDNYLSDYEKDITLR